VILETIRRLPPYQQLLANLQGNSSLEQNIPLGMMRSARPPLLAALQADLRRPILFITSKQEVAATLMDELEFWQPGISLLPFSEPATLFYEDAAWGLNIRRDRISVLTGLAQFHLPGSKPANSAPLIITSAKSLMTRTMPRRDFITSFLRFSSGSTKTMSSLLVQITSLGYTGNDTVLEPGQFARRGGVMDFWPMGDALPARLDFFGDEIESIKRFDPSTQRTVETVSTLSIPPAREFLIAGMPVLDTGHSYSEFHLPLIHRFPSTLIDYLPKSTLVVMDDGARLQGVVTELEEDAVQMRNEGVTNGSLPSDYPVPYLSWSELQDSLSRSVVLDMGHSAEHGLSDLAACFEPNQRFAGQLRQFIAAIREEENSQQVIISRQVPRIREVMQEVSRDTAGEFTTPELIEGSLTEGWHLSHPVTGELYLFSDSEIFGWEKPHSRRRTPQLAENPEAGYADLKPGDWVVHIDHGIGQYNGLVKRVLDGIRREFLVILYDGGDELFVPIHQADRLSRYVGPENQRPAASRLGGQEWAATKQRVLHAVEEVAGDLLDLYARRQLAEGFTFSQDTAWQMELEGSFPYVETPDQMDAIRAVKRDMEKSRPMDRLLCGDVGYGKTEVALRAAFKAVMDGKQVAVLVPTTILAQQHYDTFVERLLPFPARVEMLSRFRSAREQDEIISQLGMGQVDIIIGTHRLLSNDVMFKDLGLVIIDEEQRFGVTHKEALKKLRTEVDVLTLTATPIPRTLYMALTGVRDISTINTPPEERLPINTHIGPYSPHLVRQAILRELERGGQIFFLHNRVQSIPAMLMHLTKLVPEARYGIAHGQMEENELSRVMHAFTHAEIDVLLCTSIIESGLDIPNANTLIVDRADTFGLAQLYQLRGRVGRGSQRAYAYFFKHRTRVATPEGQERLEVIAENTQLGAGYSIAMRDMEMRGAGELLGNRQHGYINSVGFHLYTRMLASAVKLERRLRGLPEETRQDAFAVRELSVPVNVDLPLPVELPEEYIPDQASRLKLYRRLADAGETSRLDALAEELRDRFGALPAETDNLLFSLRVKLLAELAGLASVSMEGGQLVLRYPGQPDGSPPRNLHFIHPKVRAGRNAYWMPFNQADVDWKIDLLEALVQLATH
jgi:transcription-repair coupling factor (superfamily II helicase)